MEEEIQQPSLSDQLKSVKPTIDYTLSNLGVRGDPAMRNRAKAIAVRAIKTHDPERGSLNTHVTHQLKQMSRIVRDYRSPVKIPERQKLDAFTISNIEQDFIDEKGREPDLLELADYSGMPVERIKKIRENILKPVSEEGYFGGESGDLEDLGMVKNIEPDYVEEARDYVYHDSDYKDRKILEYYTGYGGAKILTPQEISSKLNISQSQVSRRMMRLGLKIDEIANSIRKTHGV